MTSRTTPQFWKTYHQLPESVRRQAQEAYRLFLSNRHHPGLHFKRVHTSVPIFLVRINRDYRALGIVAGESILWFWIGSHDDYEKLLLRL